MRLPTWGAERRRAVIDDEDDLDWGEDGPPDELAAPLEADSGAIRTARYDTRRKDRGEVRISVWVPADRVEEIQRIAARMRADRTPTR